MAAYLYHPKGSMCVHCAKQAEDCSKLDFRSMPVVKQYSQGGDPTVFKVVACRVFVRAA
ncbi:hypothetical protein SAMN03080615_01643 [Amphritea atlantica]|uniref:Uncharacterized protein n=1 Tax=Amphritea atlantica TaxID=355243 RepID=A0A1H9GEW8_9GAMM|nr:hypothetical protein [Amphritea atlantica]SEQ48652.1 hypothetical protein SAMN03080615_01643 [Amphritea atlantica]